MRPLEHWKVLPHGDLTPIGDNVLSVTGKLHMPLTDFERRMTVVRLRDGRLVIWNAISLDEDEMFELEQFGTPSFLIVPGARHRLDAKVWKRRYPHMKVIAPEGVRDHVAKVVPVDATTIDFDDPDVQLGNIAGTHGRELVLIIRSPGEGGETTIVVNDLIANVHGRRGFGGWLLRKLGFMGPAPQIPGIVRRMLVADTEALRKQLVAWTKLPMLRRILPAHGDPIEQPVEALRSIAAQLA